MRLRAALARLISARVRLGLLGKSAEDLEEEQREGEGGRGMLLMMLLVGLLLWLLAGRAVVGGGGLGEGGERMRRSSCKIVESGLEVWGGG